MAEMALVLSLLSLLMVVLLFVWGLRVKKQQERLLMEMLDAYTEQMEEENRRFIQNIRELLVVYPRQHPAPGEKTVLPPPPVERAEEGAHAAETLSQEPAREDGSLPAWLELAEAAQQLMAKGHSLPEVAKALRRGVGEVEMALRLLHSEKKS